MLAVWLACCTRGPERLPHSQQTDRIILESACLLSKIALVQKLSFPCLQPERVREDYTGSLSLKILPCSNLLKTNSELGVVAHSCNFITWED